MSIDLLLGKSRRCWSRGPSAPAASAGFFGPDPLVWTPSAVRAELDRVRNVVDTVNMEMSLARASKKISDLEWSSWFRTYQTAHKLTDRGSSLWGSNVKVARRHEQDALKWRETLSTRGSQLVGPRDMGQPPPGEISAWAALVPVFAGGLVLGAAVIWSKKKT